MSKNTIQENVEKAITYLKSLDPENFHSFKKIDDMFNLGANYAYRNLQYYFHITNCNSYEHNNITYRSMEAVSEYLDIDYSVVRHLFPKIKIPHTRIYKKTINNHLVINKFYNIDKIIHLLPKRFVQKYNLAKTKINNLGLIIQNNPTRLTQNEYVIYCSLILFYKQFYFWPSNKQLITFINTNFNKIFSQNAIYKIIKRLENKKYISYFKPSKYYTVYFIHKGPMLLTHKISKGYDSYFNKEITNIYIPIDTFKEI